ncbi:MAG: hypothetical protein AAF288_04480 [Planctomycetota bacterium]
MLEEQARVRVDGFDWARAFPLLRLHHAVGMAFQPSKVLAAAMVILALRGWGWVCDQMADASVGPGTAVTSWLRRAETSALQFEWVAALSDLRAAALVGPGLFQFGERWLALLWGAGVLAIAGTFGLVLGRLCAVHACDAKGVGWDRAVRFALKRWSSASLPIVLPCVVLAALFGLGELYGWAARQEGLAWLAGLGFGLAWFAALVCVVIAMLLVFGGWLIPAAVGVEAVDGFDAASRTVNYLVFQPMRALGILALGGVLGLLLLFLLSWTLTLTANFVYVLADPSDVAVVQVFGSAWPGPEGETLYLQTEDGLGPSGLESSSGRVQLEFGFGAVDPEGFSGWWVSFWIASARLLAQSILLSYAASAATWGYLILRQSRDQVDFATHFAEPAPTTAGTASAVGRAASVARAAVPPDLPPGVAPWSGGPVTPVSNDKEEGGQDKAETDAVPGDPASPDGGARP